MQLSFLSDLNTIYSDITMTHPASVQEPPRLALPTPRSMKPLPTLRVVADTVASVTDLRPLQAGSSIQLLLYARCSIPVVLDRQEGASHSRRLRSNTTLPDKPVAGHDALASERATDGPIIAPLPSG